MSIKCTSIFGHKYQPRYDQETDPKVLSAFDGITVRAMLVIIDAMKKTTYVHDVCARCGHAINRGSKS